MGETVTCLVRGPGSRYPRGYAWLVPVWFAILAGAVLVAGWKASGRLPLWLGISEIGSLALSFAVVYGVLVTSRHRAFFADEHGIWLGVPTRRRRPGLRQVHLAWPEVGLIWLEPRRYGVLLEISLVPAARIVRRPGPVRSVLLLLAVLIMPAWVGRGRPALTTPRGNPPRYRVKICDRDATTLRAALTAVRPDTVPVRVPVSKTRGGFTLPAPGGAIEQQPTAPVS